MVDLGASTDLLDWYKVLKHQDLSIKTTVISPQVWGQWNKSLPWFWTMDVWQDTDVGEWIEDCTSPFSIHTLSIYVTISTQSIECIGLGKRLKR
jgi:hypothetical protein